MSTESQSEHTFVSTREAAKLLGVSVRTVQLWVENGALLAWKTAGGHRRIVRESVNAVLAEQQAVIETASGLQPLKVVLIDDNPAQLKLYQLKLESLDLPLLLTTTTDGLEGMMVIGQRAPEVVVISLALSNIDAVALVNSIAKRLPSTRIIALAADQEGGSNLRAGRYSNRITILSPIDDLNAIGPLLNARNASAYSSRSASPSRTYTFNEDEVEQLDNHTLTSVLRDASNIEHPLPPEGESSPTIGALKFDSLVSKD